MAKVDILKNPKGVVDLLRRLIGENFEEQVRRAAEIVQEEYEIFFASAGALGLSGILGSAEVEVEEKNKNGRLNSVSVFVPKTGGGGNQVFHVLNEGIDALGAASAYGLKAWPIHLPRDPSYGSSPMTMVGSLELNAPSSDKNVIFRPVIKNPIEARGFTDEILKKAQKRIDDEGLGVTIRTSEQ